MSFFLIVKIISLIKNIIILVDVMIMEIDVEILVKGGGELIGLGGGGFIKGVSYGGEGVGNVNIIYGFILFLFSFGSGIGIVRGGGVINI